MGNYQFQILGQFLSWNIFLVDLIISGHMLSVVLPSQSFTIFQILNNGLYWDVTGG